MEAISPADEHAIVKGLTGPHGHPVSRAAIDRALNLHETERRLARWAYTDRARHLRRVELAGKDGGVLEDVGDAAAQVKVSTIGGIVTGFRGARAVADAILQRSSHELRALRRELSTHWLIRRTLHYFQQEDYSRLVDLLNASTRESLGEINRDESTRLMWNLVRRQPRLALLGLRGLLLGKR